MFRKKLRNNELNDTVIELELEDTSSPMPMMDIPGQPGAQMGMMNIGDLFGKAFQRTVKRKLTVAESYAVLIGEEADKLLDDETVNARALDAWRSDLKLRIAMRLRTTAAATFTGSTYTMPTIARLTLRQSLRNPTRRRRLVGVAMSIPRFLTAGTSMRLIQTPSMVGQVSLGSGATI